ncbi:MAG: cytochrome b N-terminal domain-containing protein [Candidatus Hodgkinia cicadicola]
MLHTSAGISAWIRAHFVRFKVPKRINLLYTLGGVLLFAIALQILTGISMAIHYVPVITKAFVSVNVIMRKFKYGWLVQNAHANGASLIFCALYIHIFKAIYYRSYVGARCAVWIIGSVMYILIMCVSFIGYILPWGQLSYWAAVVITNVISSVPLAGKWLKLLALGGYAVRDSLLKRFFVFHCFLPFALVSLTLVHLALVHSSGQNDLISNRVPAKNARANMFPVYALKDLVSICAYLLLLCLLCLVFPNALSNNLNYEPADFYNTPADIKPEWYFMQYYSVLRVFESKLAGVFAIWLTLMLIMLLPYTHKELPLSSLRALYRAHVILLFLSFIVLGALGALHLNRWLIALAKLCIISYFSFFLWPALVRIMRLLALSLIKWRF